MKRKRYKLTLNRVKSKSNPAQMQQPVSVTVIPTESNTVEASVAASSEEESVSSLIHGKPSVCVVGGCNNTAYSNIILHLWPQDTERASRWTEFVQRSRGNLKSGLSKYSYICSAHFTEDSYTHPWSLAATIGYRPKLRSDAYPTVLNPTIETQKTGATITDTGRADINSGGPKHSTFKKGKFSRKCPGEEEKEDFEEHGIDPLPEIVEVPENHQRRKGMECGKNPKSGKKVKRSKASQPTESADNRVEDEEPLLSKLVVKNGFEKKFVKQLTDFWKNKLFCDLKLDFGGFEVLAHQLVFNVAQPFWLRGLSTYKGENSVLTVEVPVVTSKEAVDSFMTYLYKGSLVITDRTFYDILNLGKFFNITSIEYFCNSFITALSNYKKATMAEFSDQEPSINDWKRDHSRPLVTHSVPKPQNMSEDGEEAGREEEDIDASNLSDFKIEIDIDGKDPVPEGVDETYLYTPQEEEDVSMEIDGKFTKISCVDDNDQEWLLMPNNMEDDSDAENECGDIELEADNRDIPFIPEIKKEGEEPQDVDAHNVTSPAKPPHKMNQVNEDSDADKSGSHELDLDSSKDIKPILLSDGSILDNHLSKDNSSYPVDKVYDGKIAVELIGKARNISEPEVNAAWDVNEEFQQEHGYRTIQNIDPSFMLEDHEDQTILGSDDEIQRKLIPKTSSQDAIDLSRESDHPTEDGSEDKEMENAGVMNIGKNVRPLTFIKEDSKVVLYDDCDISWKSQKPQQESSRNIVIDESVIDRNPRPDDEEFKQNSNFFNHFKCDSCPNIFKSRAKRQEHVQSFHRGFRFVCQFCAKRMTSLNGLKTHELEHLGEEQPYHCKRCNKQFETKSKLNWHIKRHKIPKVINTVKEEKRYNCMMCSKSFTSITCLKKHRLTIHKSRSLTRVKRKCPECSLTFKCLSSMRHHMKTKHSDTDSAKVVQREAKEMENVEEGCVREDSQDKIPEQVPERSPKPKKKRIPDRVTGTKNFHCQECGMDFLFAAYLKRHCRSEHSKT